MYRISAGIKVVPKNISSGFRIVFSNPALRAAALAAAALNAATTLVVFTIHLDLVSQEVDPLLIGWLNGAMAPSLLGGAILGGMIVPKMRVPTLVFISLTTAMVSIVGLLFFHQYAFLFVWFTILGLTTPVTGAAISGYVFTVIPIDFQGRAGSTLTALNMGLSALSPLVAGWLIQGENSRSPCIWEWPYSVPRFCCCSPPPPSARSASRPIGRDCRVRAMRAAMRQTCTMKHAI